MSRMFPATHSIESSTPDFTVVEHQNGGSILCLPKHDFVAKLGDMVANRALKKQSLYDVLITALNSVIAVLEPYVQSGKVPREPVTEARLRAEGGYIQKHYHRRDYSSLAVRHSKEWASLPQMQKAIEEFVGDSDVQKDFITTGFGNLRYYVTQQIIHQFIYRTLHLTKKWPPSACAIDRLFDDLEDYLLGATVSCEAVVPLENFECERKRLMLEPSIGIRVLSEREKEHLLSRALGGWSVENVMEIARHKFVAKISFSWQKGHTQPDHRGMIEKLLTGLRLFKTGGVGANVAYKRELKWQPGHIVGGAERHIRTLPVQGPAYELTLQEAQNLLRFWKWLYREQLSNNAAVAIRWFNHGYQDWIPEDRIVSFVIALESLFLRRSDDKRRNLVSRIPKLLTNARGRGQVERDIGDLWDLRSSVVHAEQPQATNAMRIVETAEYYLREAIRRYIELERCLSPNAHSDIVRWLDDPNVDIEKQRLFPHWQAI